MLIKNNQKCTISTEGDDMQEILGNFEQFLVKIQI